MRDSYQKLMGLTRSVVRPGDRGFFSAENEREAEALGVKKVALPARGRLSAKRAKQQKQRWFRRALR
jgi:hypothetical protein